ncbi:hypothetical protein ACFPVY_07300 [Flavobacterium qiangtangense]|uniref:DUF4231 domain-containing protein n=1 Tax=Flavobacterium qiangtangense TaxID=1442595 RepID=A0ABW1PLZ6_9FLAO
MFAINIKYKRSKTFSSETKQYLDLIEKKLIRLKVDKIDLSPSKIHFKNSFFNGQGSNHLMATVDKGYFNIDSELKELQYSFSVTRMFYITLSMSIFLGLISQSYLATIFFFLFLFGTILAITLIRHKMFLNKLISQL